MSLTQFSLSRPVTIFMVFLSFIVLGGISYFLIPMEFFPAVDAPFIFVWIPYPGATPEEIENQITSPAEEALALVTDVKDIYSESAPGRAWIRLDFQYTEKLDTNIKAIEAREKLDAVRHLFPDDLDRFYIFKWSTEDMPIIQLRFSSSKDLSGAYDMLDRNVKRKLERIPGVSKVELYGTAKKRVEIQISLDKIITHKIDLRQLLDKLRKSDFALSAGKISRGGKEMQVRIIGEFQTLDEIKNLPITNTVKLSDIAQITFDMPEMDEGRHLNRAFAAGLEVYKSSGANTIEISNRVLDTIEEIKKNPEMEGVNLFFIENVAEGITSSIKELFKSGMLGAFLAVLILLFFLRRISTTMIVVLSVPFSLLVTGVFMYFLGISLNILSMMGLLLAVGMLVDNAVVAMESIHRYEEEELKKLNGSADEKTQKKIKKAAVLKGVKKIAMAITSGTLTTVIVFLPNIVSPKAQVSLWLKHVGLTLVIALLASLVIAQTIVPLLAYKLKEKDYFKKKKENLADKLTAWYSKILKWKLDHHKASVLIMFGVLFSIVIPMNFVKQDMFPQQMDRKIRIHYHINGSYKLEIVENAVNIMEDFIYENEDRFEIESVYSYYNSNYATTTINLKTGDEAKRKQDEITEEIKEEMPKIAIGSPTFKWQRSGGEGNTRIVIHGKSIESLTKITKDIAKKLSYRPEFTEVLSEAEKGEKEIQISVDREKAKLHNISAVQAASTVSAAMRGTKINTFKDENGETDIMLQFRDKDTENLSNLKELPIFTPDGNQIELQSIAQFKTGMTPKTINRENRATSMGVTMQLKDIDQKQAKDILKNFMENYKLPPGYKWSFGKSFSHEDETQKTMLVNILLALALIYFVMASLFESFVFPAAIWSSIIFSVVGVFWFFLITGSTFSIMAMIGILILIGVVVNNGIVLIDHINQLRAEGIDRYNAILRAGSERLRPILMTAGTTVLSLVPLTIVRTQIGGNGPPYFPMARAIVGGLTFSTLVTIFILPTIYTMLDDLRIWSSEVLRQALKK